MKKNPLKLSPVDILKRGNYLYHLSYWIYGLFWDFRLAGKSLNDTVFNDNECAYPAQNLSYIYLRELVKIIEYNKKDVFVDVGCAWGRLLFYLQKKTSLENFIGVELNEPIAKNAQSYFENNPKIRIINGDILEVLPETGTIFFLFNPFDAKTLSLFLDLIEKNIRHKVTLIYLYPTCREEIDSRSCWHLINHTQLKPKHMGALDICIYEFQSLALH